MAKVASVSYNSCKLIPVQFINFQKNYQKSSDGTSIGALFSIQIQGTLVAWKGSPMGSGLIGDANYDATYGAFWVAEDNPPDEVLGTFNHFDHIINKQEYMRRLFSVEGRLLEIQSCDGTPPIKCNPRILSIAFEPGNWVDRCGYTIDLEADVVVGEIITGDYGEDTFTEFISEASENWQLENLDSAENVSQQHTWRLTHNVQAKGKRFYDVAGALEKPAWEQARSWVHPRLGLDLNRISATGVIDLVGFGGFNHIRSESVDEMDGTYAVTETWLLATGIALEDFTVTSRFTAEDPVRVVTIEGSIQGLEINTFPPNTGSFGVNVSKYTNANSYFSGISGALYGRASTYAEASNFPRTLQTAPLSVQIGRNPVAGTITYSYDYSTRRGPCIDGALWDNITITDNAPVNMFASIFVMGRARGPVLQDLNTVSEFRRTVNVDVVMHPPTGCPTTVTKVQNWLTQSPYEDVDVIIDAFYNHLLYYYDQVFVAEDTDSWDPSRGAYNRSITWVAGDCS
jgi:hypothetical protein